MPDYLANLLRRPPVGWRDLLDIAIVSFLIYEFLLLIRGTRAVQMGVGTLLIVALIYVSRLAPLQTVNCLIRGGRGGGAGAAGGGGRAGGRRARARGGRAPGGR